MIMEEVADKEYMEVWPDDFARLSYYDNEYLKQFNRGELKKLFEGKVVLLADPDFLYGGRYRLVEVKPVDHEE
jgi:hypothetical protein